MLLGISFLIVLIVSILVGVFIVQLIWNQVMPDVFGLKQIDFWQTLGLLILANVFFGAHCNASNVSLYQ